MTEINPRIKNPQALDSLVEFGRTDEEKEEIRALGPSVDVDDNGFVEYEEYLSAYNTVRPFLDEDATKLRDGTTARDLKAALEVNKAFTKFVFSVSAPQSLFDIHYSERPRSFAYFIGTNKWTVGHDLNWLYVRQIDADRKATIRQAVEAYVGKHGELSWQNFEPLRAQIAEKIGYHQPTLQHGHPDTQPGGDL